MVPIKELMTIKSFLEVYCISRSRLYSEIKIGNIRATKVGSRTYIKRIDADEWLKDLGRHR